MLSKYCVKVPIVSPQQRMRAIAFAVIINQHDTFLTNWMTNVHRAQMANLLINNQYETKLDLFVYAICCSESWPFEIFLTSRELL